MKVKSMNKAVLLSVLEAGAKLYQSEVMAANDYRPKRTTTEYLLTATIMRASLKHSEHVRVEPLCKRVVNVMTSSASPKVRKSFGKKRFDVLIGDYLSPQAVFEVKIGIRSAKKLIDDVDKIIDVAKRLDRLRAPFFGTLVFEIDVPGCGTVAEEQDFRGVFNKLYGTIKDDLTSHIKNNNPSVNMEFSILCEAIEPAEIVDDAIDSDGAATFICAAIIEFATNQ